MIASERLKVFWQEVRDGKRPKPERDPNAPTEKLLRCNSSWARDGQIILIIYPHGELGFREPRRRAEYKIGLPEAYRQAVLITTGKINMRVRDLRKHGMRLSEARRKARKELL